MTPTQIDAASLAGDILKGATAIAEFIGTTDRAALHLCYTGQVPAFKRGGQWCMRKSRYRRHLEDLENATLARRQSEYPAAHRAGRRIKV